MPYVAAPGVDDLLRVLPQFLERDRRAVRIETGLLEHRLVVEQHRGRDVQRHRPLHAAGLVGEHRPRQERRDVEVAGLHACRRRDHGVGIGHLLEHVLGHLHDVRSVRGACQEVLVDQLFVAVLVLQLDNDAILAGVVQVGEVDEGLALGRLHGVPERDVHRLVDRVEGVHRTCCEIRVASHHHRHTRRGTEARRAGAARRGRRHPASTARTRQIVVGGPPAPAVVAVAAGLVDVVAS